MIDQLKKAVYKRFGPVYGSSELKAARDKLCEQCREVYKQERWAGSVATEAALQAALPTAEEVEAARAPHVRPGMARAYYLGIIITCVIAVVPILFSVWVCHEAAARTGYAGTWSYCFKTSLGVLLLLAAALLVQCRKVKVVPILCILVGAPILLYNMFPILMIWAGNKAERKPMHYDYTDRIGSVESIDLVRLDDYARESSEGECLDYTILKTLDPEQYAPILRDLAGLRYLMVMDPPALSKGRIMVLIRFSPGEDDLRYAFLGSSNPGQVTWNGTEYRLTYYNCVAYEAWDELASKYFPGAPLR